MPKFIDITGKVFNNWTVINKSTSKNRSVYYSCKCLCGVTKEVQSYKLRSGLSKSCGCLYFHENIEMLRKSRTSHGFTKNYKIPRIYRIWSGMVERCKKNSKKYKWYGSRGITVCDEWINDFNSFQKWAYSNGYSDKLEIDRIDNDGNYEPKNCRWVTHKENCKNRGKRQFR